MPAAQYWRITQIESYLGDGLTLSDVALYASGARQDGSATLSSVVAPVSGTMWTGAVTWADILAPGFALVWDFGGSAPSIDRVDITGPSQSTFAHKFAVQYSSDGVAWTLVKSCKSAFQGAGVAYSLDLTTPTDVDPELLLLGNGANGSTTITDSSTPPKTVTAYGNARISTAQSPFGGSSSIYFGGSGSGTGDHLKVPLSEAISPVGNENFTIEGWIYKPSGTGYEVLFCNGYGIQIYLNSGNIEVYLSSVATSGSYFVNALTGPANSVVLNTWVHFALVRNETVVTVYVNGVGGTPATGVTGLLPEPVVDPRIGSWLAGGYWYLGYLSNLRVKRGRVLYTANFTPPTAAFSPGAAGDVTPLRSRPAAPTMVGSVAIGDTQIIVNHGGVALDLEDGGLHRVTVTVKEKALPTNTPLKRKVRLHREPDGRPIRETWSDATTGECSFDYIRGDVTYYATAFDYLHNYRAVIADNLTPELMP